MKALKTSLRLLSVMGLIVLLVPETDAQHYRGRRYGHYYGPRSSISFGIGVNPYYGYRSIARPRNYYHRPYRLPYRYHYGPAFGLGIGILPFGYSRFSIGGSPYYYYDGIYYRPYSSGGYTVAPPPLGAMVKRLPSGAKVTVIDGQKYYVLGGTFYQEKISPDNKRRYQVVGTDGVLNTDSPEPSTDGDEPMQVAPEPSVNSAPQPAEQLLVDQLPQGSTAITISEQKYYLSPDGVYYQEVVDSNNKVSYKIAGSHSGNSVKDTEVPGGQ